MTAELYSNYKCGIKKLCGASFDPEIPLDSFVYLIEGNLYNKLTENKENQKEILVSLNGLIANPNNASLVNDEIIHFLIEKLHEGQNDQMACIMIDILCKRVGFFFDSKVLKKLSGLYSSLPTTQALQLTQSLSHTLLKNNEPKIYYSFSGFCTAISVVLSTEEWPQETSIYHSSFRPTKLIEGNTPLIFSFSSNSFEVSLCVNTQTNHLFLKTDTFMTKSTEKKPQRKSRMSMTRIFDTQIVVALNEWHSIYIIHKNDDSFQIMCNNQLSPLLTVAYPVLEKNNITLLQIGGNCDKSGFCFVGDITGFQWYHNCPSIESTHKYFSNDTISETESNQKLALQISPLKSMAIGHKTFFKKVDSIVNQANGKNSVSICSSKINSDFSPIFAASCLKLDDMVLRFGGMIPFLSLMNFGFNTKEYNISNTPAMLQIISSILKHNEVLKSQCEKIHFYNILLQFMLLSVNKEDMGCIIDYLSICVRLFTSNISFEMKKVIVRYMFDIGHWIGIEKCVCYPEVLRKLVPPTQFVSLDLFQFISYEHLVMYIVSDEEKMDIMPVGQWLYTKCKFVQYCVDIITRCDMNKFIDVVLSTLANTKSSSVINLMLYSILCILCSTTEPPEVLKQSVSFFYSTLNTHNPYTFCFSLKILYALLGETKEVLDLVMESFERIDMVPTLYETIIECSTGRINSDLNKSAYLENVVSLKYPTILINFISIAFKRIIESTSEEELTTVMLRDFSCRKRGHPLFSIIATNKDWEKTFYSLLDFLQKKKDQKNVLRIMKIMSKIILESFRQYQTAFLTSSLMKLHNVFTTWKDLYGILFNFFKIFLEMKPFLCEFPNILIVECGSFLSLITCGMFNYGRNDSTFHFDDHFNLISDFFTQIDVSDCLKQFNDAFTYQEQLYPIYYYFNINLIISHLKALTYKSVVDVTQYIKLFEILCGIFPIYPPKRNHVNFFNWFLFSTTTFFNKVKLNQEEEDKLETYHLNCLESIRQYNSQLYDELMSKRREILEDTFDDIKFNDSMGEFYDSLVEAYHSTQNTIGVERIVFDNYNVTPTTVHKTFPSIRIPQKLNEKIPFDIKKYNNDIMAFREKELLRFKHIQRKYQMTNENESSLAFDCVGYNNPLNPSFVLKKYCTNDIIGIQERFISDPEIISDVHLPLNAESVIPCVLINLDEYEYGLFFIIENTIHLKTKNHWHERPFTRINAIVQRKFKENENCCEIFSFDKKPLFVVFLNQTNCQTIFARINNFQIENKTDFSIIPNPSKLFISCTSTKDWIEGRITTYKYLFELNFYSGRSLMDISQYYIFPWITTTFDRPLNVLYNNKLFIRNLSQNRCNLQEGYFDKNSLKYGPLPGIVVPMYLNQLEPYKTLYSLFESHLISSKNIFTETTHLPFNYKSIPYPKLLDITQISTFEFPFETIPQFYSVSSLFTTNESDFSHISFPKTFAENPKQFILYHRMLLEAPNVSEEINKWFDMVFGKRMNDKNIPENSKKNSQSKMSQMVGQQPQLLFKTHQKRKKSFDYNHIIKIINNESNSTGIKTLNEFNQFDGNINSIELMDYYSIISTNETISIVYLNNKKMKRMNIAMKKNSETRKLLFFDGEDGIGAVIYFAGCSEVIIYYKDQCKNIKSTPGNITCVTLKELIEYTSYELIIGTYCGQLEQYKITINKEFHEINVVLMNRIIVSSNPLTKIISLPSIDCCVIKSMNIYSYSTKNGNLLSTINCEKEPVFVCASSNGNIYYSQQKGNEIEICFSDTNSLETGTVLIKNEIISLSCICSTFIDFVIITTIDEVMIYLNTYSTPILIHTINFNSLFENVLITEVITQPSSLTTENKDNWIFIVKAIKQSDNTPILRSFLLDDVKLITL